MGGGTYSYTASVSRSADLDYKSKPVYALFKQREIKNDMSPVNVEVRESRDSSEHPTSLAIVLALDVTGSMGKIPHYLISEGFPNIMNKIMQNGISHPQVLFMGIGDHECDTSPLQIGQFESSDELLEKWMLDLWLEGGGGGNDGESYLLSWYFAGMKTAIDCHEKRNQKGFLFTIGDEPTLRTLPKNAVKSIMGGDEKAVDYSAVELLEKAREKYHVFHIHLKQGSNGTRKDVINGWKELIGEDNLIVVDNYEDLCYKIPEVVNKYVMGSETVQAESSVEASDDTISVRL